MQSASLLQMEDSTPISALNLMHYELHVFSCAKLDSDAKKKGVDQNVGQIFRIK
jgi:hypothetical protein